MNYINKFNQHNVEKPPKVNGVSESLGDIQGDSKSMDRILDKIKKSGMESLTPTESDTLAENS